MSAKGMMLSERPSGGGGGGGGGAASSPVKIGNYKGVMLCNRPFAGTQAAAKGSISTSNGGGDGGKPAFLTGNPTGKIGGNVSIMSKEKQHATVNRSKKDTAPSKHKKWLRDLQKTKNELESQMLREMEEKEKAKSKFMEREAKMRAAVRGSEAKLEDGDDTMYESKATNQEDTYSERISQLEAEKKRVLAGRPAWSLTEGDAKEAVDAKEDMDADELMDFAAQLDFDQYIEDTEVNAMREQVEQRVDELNAAEDAKLAEDALAGEEMDDDECEMNAESKESSGDGAAGDSKVTYAKLTSENVAKLGSDMDGKEIPDDLRSVARSMMSEGKMSIHSERSLNMLAKRAKEKLSSELPPVVEPKIVTTQEDGGSRMAIKKETSNLPYMHRNPAV